MTKDQERIENLLDHLTGHKDTREKPPNVTGTLAAGCVRSKRPFPGSEGRQLVKQPDVPIHHPYDPEG